MAIDPAPSSPSDDRPDPDRPGNYRLPKRLVWASDLAWRIIVLAVVALGLTFLAWELRVVALPILIALALSTVLVPPARWMARRGVPPLVATWLVFLGAFAFIAGIVAVVAPPFVDQFDELGDAASEAVDDLRDWLVEGPLGLSEGQIDDAVDDVTAAAGERSEELTAAGLTGVRILADLIVGAVVSMVLTFFFVKDGEKITGWILDQVRPATAVDLREIGNRIWTTVAGYFRGVAIDGVIEAVLIGAALWILGVPLVLPLAVITFFGGFFPLVGAIVAGALAAMVALVTEGPVTALIIIAWSIVVQNLISNVFDPLVMSRAVRLHPVVVLAAVTSGGLLGGLIGAFLAVPLTATAVNVGAYYLHDKPGAPEEGNDEAALAADEPDP